MKQTQNSSIKAEEIKPEALKMPYLPYVDAGRNQPGLDSSQIRQKPKVGSFTITATGTKLIHIGFSPSLLEIKGYDTGHSAYSEAIITPGANHCIYKDSGGNYAEATANTVVYLSHAGITSAIIEKYDSLFKINCTSFNHDAVIHWIAHP